MEDPYSGAQGREAEKIKGSMAQWHNGAGEELLLVFMASGTGLFYLPPKSILFLSPQMGGSGGKPQWSGKRKFILP